MPRRQINRHEVMQTAALAGLELAVGALAWGWAKGRGPALPKVGSAAAA